MNEKFCRAALSLYYVKLLQDLNRPSLLKKVLAHVIADGKRKLWIWDLVSRSM
jgi:hypothetical protein